MAKKSPEPSDDQLTHFPALSNNDGQQILIPYPSQEQLAEMVLPLFIANPSGHSHARTALKIWENCFVELSRHRASTMRVLAIDQETKYWCEQIKLPDDDCFPMPLDDLLKRQGRRSPELRRDLFKRHLKELPLINSNGSVRINQDTNKPILRSDSEVEEFLEAVSTIKSAYHYYYIAQPFKKWLMKNLSERGRKGGKAKAKKSR